jgi:O-antigen/teichoic acid export membrane protein
MSSFIEDVFKVGFSKLAIILFSLGSGVIAARWLGPEANGIIAALTVYPTLFLTFGSLGISQATTHFMGKGEFSEKSIKTSITHIWLLTSLLSVVICYIIVRYFSNSGSNPFWVLLVILPIPFSLFNTYNSGIYLGKNQIGAYNRINWLPTAVVFILIFLLLVIFKFGITGALIAYIGGPVLMFFLLLFKNKFISAVSLNIHWNVISALLKLGIIYAIALLAMTLNYRIDIILLDKLSNPFELGIYSKGVAITETLWQIPALLSTIVFARSATAKDDLQFSRKVAQLLRLSLIVIGIGSILLAIFARYIVLIMYGQKFVNSTQVLQFLMPGVMLLTVFKVLNMDLAGKGKPWISMKAMVPGLILNVVLNLFLIPPYGANGAAISSTVSYTFGALLFMHFYSREVRLSFREIVTYSRRDFEPLTSFYRKVRLAVK